jgi:hypothetical protein
MTKLTMSVKRSEGIQNQIARRARERCPTRAGGPNCARPVHHYETAM